MNTVKQAFWGIVLGALFGAGFGLLCNFGEPPGKKSGSPGSGGGHWTIRAHAGQPVHDGSGAWYIDVDIKEER